MSVSAFDSTCQLQVFTYLLIYPQKVSSSFVLRLVSFSSTISTSSSTSVTHNLGSTHTFRCLFLHHSILPFIANSCTQKARGLMVESLETWEEYPDCGLWLCALPASLRLILNIFIVVSMAC